MISDEIKNRASHLVSTYNFLQAYNPNLKLDYSWESLGLLDAILRPYRGANEIDVRGADLIKNCAAYLACITDGIWTRFGCHVNADEGAQGIRINAVGGEVFGNSGSHKFDLETILREVIQTPPETFPVLTEFIRPVSYDDNLVQLLALGLFTGLSPMGEGALEKRTTEDFRLYLDVALKELAKGCGERYASLYPDEQLGQLPELYLNQLIFPPLLMEEYSIASGATLGLLSFFSEYSVKENSQIPLVRNLMSSLDETYSLAATCYYGAILSTPPSLDDIKLAQIHSRLNKIARPTVLGIRAASGIEKDWLLESPSEKDVVRYEIERAFGFFYWSQLGLDFLMARGEKESLLLKHISFGELEEARELLDQLLTEKPNNAELLIQAAFIDYDLGKHDKCKENLGKIEINDYAPALHRGALLKIVEGNIGEAIKDMEKALTSTGGDVYFQSELQADYEWLLLQAGKVEEVVERPLDTGIKEYFLLVRGLNRLDALWDLHRIEEFEVQLKELAAIDPLHPAIFDAMMANAQV